MAKATKAEKGAYWREFEINVNAPDLAMEHFAALMAKFAQASSQFTSSTYSKAAATAMKQASQWSNIAVNNLNKFNQFLGTMPTKIQSFAQAGLAGFGQIGRGIYSLGVFSFETAFVGGLLVRKIYEYLRGLARKALEDRRRSLQDYASYSGLNAFQINFLPILGSPEDVLDAIGNAIGNQTGPEAQGLRYLGVGLTDDSSDIAASAAAALSTWVRGYSYQALIPMATAFGITSIFSEDDIVRAKRANELGPQALARYKIDKQILQLTDAQLKGWADLDISIDRFWLNFDMIFTRFFTPLAPTFNKLSEVTSTFIVKLINSGNFALLIDKVGTGLDKFAAFLTDPTTNQYYTSILSSLKTLADTDIQGQVNAVLNTMSDYLAKFLLGPIFSKLVPTTETFAHILNRIVIGPTTEEDKSSSHIIPTPIPIQPFKTTTFSTSPAYTPNAIPTGGEMGILHGSPVHNYLTGRAGLMRALRYPVHTGNGVSANVVPYSMDATDLDKSVYDPNDPYKGLRLKSQESVAGGEVDWGLIALARHLQSTDPDVGLFTAFHDRYHVFANPGSKHNQGLAFDVSMRDGNYEGERAKMRSYLNSLGLKENQDFWIEPGTQDHMHVQFQSHEAAKKYLQLTGQLKTPANILPSSDKPVDDSSPHPTFKVTPMQVPDNEDPSPLPLYKQWPSFTPLATKPTVYNDTDYDFAWEKEVA